MSRGFNQVQILGNLGADPEIRTTPTGAKVATISLAATDVWKDGDGNKKERTEWVRVSMWKGLADVAEKHLKKGMQVFVQGRMRTTKYTDNDGVDRWSTEVVATDFRFTGQPQGDGGNRQPDVPADALDDEIPF